MADQGWSWCPQCRRWVPESDMIVDFVPMEPDDPAYDVNNKKRLVRVCKYCLGEKEATREFVLDEHHEETQCIFCDSWNTYEPDNKQHPFVFKCRECGETFNARY